MGLYCPLPFLWAMPLNTRLRLPQVLWLQRSYDSVALLLLDETIIPAMAAVDSCRNAEEVAPGGASNLVRTTRGGDLRADVFYLHEEIAQTVFSFLDPHGALGL